MTESPPPPTPEPAKPETPTTGWVTPQLPVRQASPFRSAATRARWLVWLLVANVIVMVASVAISLWGKAAISGYDAGEGTVADLDRFDATFAVSGIISILVWVPTVIAWLAWSSRTVDNEDALGIGPSKVSPRWAMGWWFVPFANLVMPYRTHREIYDRYHIGVAAGAGFVLLWWVVYLADNFLSNVVGRVWLAAETFEELQTGLTLYTFSDLLTAISAILALVLVRRIQRRADVLAASGAPEALSIPPAAERTVAPSAHPGEPATEPAAGSAAPTEPGEPAWPRSEPDPP
jgi:hypothetical protein